MKPHTEIMKERNKPQKRHSFSQSELEVIKHMKGEFKLPKIGRTLKNHKRHEKAIQSLKDKNVIYKNPHDILVFVDVTRVLWL